MHASWGKAPTSLSAVWFAREGYALRRSAFLTPSPMTAEEESTSDPSPCPLPEGEGSPPEHRFLQIPTYNIRRRSDNTKWALERSHIRTENLLPPGEGRVRGRT